MKAVIMAGGEGSRLRPLTSLRPKPMVPIVNQPVMEHILGLVKHHGIDEVVATLAFMPQAIQDYFGDGEEWGTRIQYALEETPLGTAGSVKNAQSLLDAEEPFLIISGDALTDLDLKKLIDEHKRLGGAVTIALKQVDNPLEFGVVITAEDGRIERFMEKPTWGQVFSDQINTGIYVIEPWVLDEIPAGEPYDFSSDLFPRLMEAGHALYGVAQECYWCDVGSRQSYLEVHRDVLDETAMVYVPGVHARKGLWVADSAMIEPDVVLGDKVVIGQNTKVRSGARIGDYTVIGDNCVIGNDARVSHSVIWDDTYVGNASVVSGSVLCRHVDVRARSVLDVGVTLGDESVVGHGAHIGADVQVYPYKRIEPAAVVNSSLIWESTASRALFGDGGIKGLVGIDITPEIALKVAEAFASIQPRGGHVVVSRDSSKPARMLKRAMVAGLNAAGVNVRDLRVASPAVSRFTTQKTRCVGGVHVSVVEHDPELLEFRFFDANGLDVSPAVQKKIERLYFRGEFRRAFFEDVGEIMYPARPLEYYAAALNDAVVGSGMDGGWKKIVADMGCGAASLVLPQVAHDWRLNVVALNPVVDTESGGCASSTESNEQLRRTVDLFGADLGVLFDRGAERVTLMSTTGVVLDGDTALHALVDVWCRTRADAEGAIAVPLHASSAVDAIAARYSRSVVRPGRSRRALAQAVLDGRAVFAGSTLGGFIFGDFFPAYDGVLTVGMLTGMLNRLETTLDEVVEGLPEFHKAEISVFCPAARKGAVMRLVTDRASSMKAQLTEGVRVVYEDGWALVLPGSSEPSVTVWSEGPDSASAVGRAEEWAEVVRKAIAETD
jgi:mannose-1-phosphate guanylyltransferase/phosphomannomutase